MAGDRLAARLADLDVALERADDLRDSKSEKLDAHAVLQRIEEQLLPREPVEVGVGVPEADEVERLLAVELLVAGMQVDLRVAAGPPERVDVAVVDVDVDAVQLVHEQLEAVEVDRDQVVDRQARQLRDGLERARRARRSTRRR